MLDLLGVPWCSRIGWVSLGVPKEDAVGRKLNLGHPCNLASQVTAAITFFAFLGVLWKFELNSLKQARALVSLNPLQRNSPLARCKPAW